LINYNVGELVIVIKNCDTLMEQYTETEGLLDDVEQEESDTKEQFREHITINTAIKPILDKIQGLVEELDK
jgi:hypothetical protein